MLLISFMERLFNFDRTDGGVENQSSLNEEQVQIGLYSQKIKNRTIDYSSLVAGGIAFLSRNWGFEEGRMAAYRRWIGRTISERNDLSREQRIEYANNLANENDQFPAPYSDLAMTAAGTALMFNMVMTLLSKHVPFLQVFKQMGYGFFTSGKSEPEKLNLQKIKSRISDPRFQIDIEVSLAIMNNEYDRTLRAMQMYLQMRKEKEYSTTFSEKLTMPIVMLGQMLVACKSPTARNNMNAAKGAAAAGMIILAPYFIKRCAQHDPAHAAEWAMMTALAYSAAKSEEKACPYFRNSLELLLQKGRQFRKVGESRNEVLEWEGSEFFREFYIFKKGKVPERLNLEMKIAELHRAAYQEEKGRYSFIPLEEPLAFLDDSILVTRRMKGKTMAEIAASSPHNAVVAEYRKAMITLAELAAWSTPAYRKQAFSIPVYDHEAEFSRRVIARLGAARFTNIYLREMAELKEIASRCSPVLAHRDAADNNLLADGYIIDFETAGPADPTLDASTAVNNPRLTQDDQEELFQVYYNELRAASSERYDYGLLHELFRRNREFNCICQAAANSAKSNDKDREKGRQQAHQARVLLQQRDPALAASFQEYLSASPCLS